MIRVCGWCGIVIGESPEGEGITHGMCPKCLKKMIDETKRNWGEELRKEEAK